MTANPMNRFPLYIPSKGRYNYCYTSEALTIMGLKHSIIVEPQEVEKYEAAVKEKNLLARIVPLDMEYKKKYETCDNISDDQRTGSGPARNFIWDLSIEEGHDWHWIMDDNILRFLWFNKNIQYRVDSPIFFQAMEDFVLRYENVGMAGPQYDCFAPRKEKIQPFIPNTRIFSCNLIRNELPFRWRGRYNEDTILSIDMLKAGWCTILFQAFLQKKLPTQSVPGGNTDELYHPDGVLIHGEEYARGGTDPKSQMLANVHPDCCVVVKRFSRTHHKAKLGQFKNMKLVKKEGLKIEKGVNNYGLKLKQFKPSKSERRKAEKA